jgi:protein-tyrosine phosphatase
VDDPRFVNLAGANNVRDLGGLPTADGHLTRSGRILRSDFLVKLDQADEHELLARFGLRSVIDLRTAAEVAAFPGPWESVGVAVVRAALPLDPAFAATGTTDMISLYASFMEPPAPAMKKALTALIDVERQPTLIHCAAGKDRTGVLVALALDLIGVARAAIGLDYSLTHDRMPRVIKRLEAEAGRRRASTLPEVMYGAEASTIEAFLAAVDERFGGTAGWAESRGIDAAAIERFRHAMVDRRPTNRSVDKVGRSGIDRGMKK